LQEQNKKLNHFLAYHNNSALLYLLIVFCFLRLERSMEGKNTVLAAFASEIAVEISNLQG